MKPVAGTVQTAGASRPPVVQNPQYHTREVDLDALVRMVAARLIQERSAKY